MDASHCNAQSPSSPIKNTQCIVVDCGGTKADWCLLSDCQDPVFFKTKGINVSLSSSESFSQFFSQSLEPYHTTLHYLEEIHFYGAGCTEFIAPKIAKQIQTFYPHANTTANSDLLGAARALCGRDKGIVAILGTGANSCYFDGEKMKQHIPALGYILGDEGSGAVLGRRLLSDIFKGLLPKEIIRDFQTKYPLTESELIQHVYREEGANHYMASFVPFLSKHRKHPAISSLLQEEFNLFFERNIMQYDALETPISFVGGVANAFSEIILMIAQEKGLTIGNFLVSPIQGLATYHAL